jgi:hypothetical protein
VFVSLSKAQVDTLVHHYSSMDAERRKDHSGCDDVVRNIERFHMQSNGWAGIAYSYLYCQHGHVYEGRGWFKLTAATLGHNGHTQAACFLGPDVKLRDDLTAPGREAASYLTNEFLRLFGKSKKVGGHRQFVNTSCPGDEIMAWIAAKGWLVDDPIERPWPLPIPKWFWPWAKWQRERMTYPSRAAWLAKRPESAKARVPDWAWVRLAAMTPKV